MEDTYHLELSKMSLAEARAKEFETTRPRNEGPDGPNGKNQRSLAEARAKEFQTTRPRIEEPHGLNSKNQRLLAEARAKEFQTTRPRFEEPHGLNSKSQSSLAEARAKEFPTTPPRFEEPHGLNSKSQSSLAEARAKEFPTGPPQIEKTKNAAFQLILRNTKTEILVYSKDITSLDVDCVVNSASEMLNHSGGLANAIAEKAGHALTKECEVHINQKGRLSVGEVLTTTGGRMCKYIIHSVGPAWDEYQGHEDACIKLLHQAYWNSFEEAVRLKVVRLAVPAISSGVLGVPISQGVDVLWDAIMKYDKVTPQAEAIKELHLVNLTRDITQAIATTFQKNVSEQKWTPWL